MKTPEENRLKLLGILNAHFSEYNSTFHLEDYQVEIVLNAMTQCQADNSERKYTKQEVEDIYLTAYEDGQNNRFLAKENFLTSLNKQNK